MLSSIRFSFAGLLALALNAAAVPPGTVAPYPQDVTLWEEAAMPPWVDEVEHTLWWIAASSAFYCPYGWDVLLEGGEVRAKLAEWGVPYQPERPGFASTAKLPKSAVYAPVDDGWIVGMSEFPTGTVHWYSRDGSQSYKISDHRVAGFVSRADGLYAIEGTGHLNDPVLNAMGYTTEAGSLIRIVRPSHGGRWQAETVTSLPSSPYAVSAGKNGTLYITLADSLVSVDREAKISTLYSFRRWSDFVPNNSVLSTDGRKLYIGMRQFVGEFDFETRELRLLLPSEAFRGRIPEKDEKELREMLMEGPRASER